VATIQETLAQVRAKYGPAPTRDECGAICNETAYWHRNDPEAWGVNQKTGGAYSTRYDGQRIASDIIQSGATKEAYDCLVAAGDGGPATPAWNPVGQITDPARPWIAPIPPQGNPPDPPDPPDPPVPGDCPCKEELAVIKSEINALAQAIVALSNQLALESAELEALARVGRTFQFRIFGVSGNGSVNSVP